MSGLVTIRFTTNLVITDLTFLANVLNYMQILTVPFQSIEKNLANWLFGRTTAAFPYQVYKWKAWDYHKTYLCIKVSMWRKDNHLIFFSVFLISAALAAQCPRVFYPVSPWGQSDSGNQCLAYSCAMRQIFDESIGVFFLLCFRMWVWPLLTLIFVMSCGCCSRHQCWFQHRINIRVSFKYWTYRVASYPTSTLSLCV